MVEKLISKRVVLRLAPNLVIHTTHPPAFCQQNPETATDPVSQCPHLPRRGSFACRSLRTGTFRVTRTPSRLTEGS
jgi:hypothetical protein